MKPLAWLSSEGRTYFAQLPSAHRIEPDSAVVSLIQGIWEADPGMARKHLRSRIYSCDPGAIRLSEMDIGMVRVAAKRLTAFAEPPPTPFSGTVIDVRSFAARARQRAHQLWHQENGRTLTLPEALAVARERTESLDRAQVPLYTRDRAVAALLLSNEGELLASAVNTNASNRTLHAEVNLVQGFWLRHGRGLPPGSRVIVTLRCCKMCAAMILHAAEEPSSIHVYYGEDDPGRMARNSALARAGLETPLT